MYCYLELRAPESIKNSKKKVFSNSADPNTLTRRKQLFVSDLFPGQLCINVFQNYS